MTESTPRIPQPAAAPEPASATTDLLAEDLLLLLFQPTSGTIAGEGTLFYVLAGAVLAELAQTGAVEAEAVAMGTLVTATDQAPTEPLLAEAWNYLAPKPRYAQTLLAAVGPTLRGPVLDRLVADGHLVREQGTVLRVIPTEKLSLGETGRRDELVARVRAVLVDGAEPDDRTAALAALLSASGSLPVLHRDIPWSSAVATRAKELEHGDWGAGSAGVAVTRTMMAIVVNAVVGATVASTVIASKG